MSPVVHDIADLVCPHPGVRFWFCAASCFHEQMGPIQRNSMGDWVCQLKNCSPPQDNSGVSMNQDSPECEVQRKDGANATTELVRKEIHGSLKKTDDPGIQTMDD